MQFDKFGAIAILIGALLCGGMLHFWFQWNWLSAIITAITGGLTILGVLLIVIGVLLMVL